MFQLLYCFFAIERGRRKMLNFNIRTPDLAP